ncbi:MAG: SPOR domain-containing protein [Spirochaetaceae bacterium]|jgi:rare lipoprotein A|nr:SPOR domain-containing protein [Spirochaetaceae bacterium]
MQQLPAQARVSPIPPQTADSINWPSYPAAEITGAPIVQGHKYRLQVGSFKVAKNAVETFNRLDSAGLNPMYEQYEDYYRVVLTNVSAENIPQTAARLGQAGFSSVMAHEER